MFSKQVVETVPTKVHTDWLSGYLSVDSPNMVSVTPNIALLARKWSVAGKYEYVKHYVGF